jgi:hypothetical protein
MIIVVVLFQFFSCSVVAVLEIRRRATCRASDLVGIARKVDVDSGILGYVEKMAGIQGD